MRERILKAFFHRTRRAFVPWTPLEIARRTKEPLHVIDAALVGLAVSGLAASIKAQNRHDHGTWHLTEAGKAIALSIITADAFAKGGNA